MESTIKTLNLSVAPLPPADLKSLYGLPLAPVSIINLKGQDEYPGSYLNISEVNIHRNFHIIQEKCISDI